MIPRISEALDAELIHQGKPIANVDAERLAIAAIEELATQLANEGFLHPARWLRSQIGEKA
jgi:hypothetical protein